MAGRLASLFARLGGDTVAPVDSLSEARTGNAALVGLLRTKTPIFSPIKHRACAGFYYRSTYRYGSRMRGFVQQRLRDALTYAEGLTLELPDGTVVLTPKRNDVFTPEDHQALSAQGFDGFKASETLLPEDAQVIVRGKLRRDRGGGGWTMVVQAIVHEEPNETKRRKRQASTGGAGTARGGRKRR